jgi:hypothetical protein
MILPYKNFPACHTVLALLKIEVAKLECFTLRNLFRSAASMVSIPKQTMPKRHGLFQIVH